MPKQIADEIEKLITAILKPIGLVKKKGKSWYLKSEENTRVFNLQRSQWSDRYYVNIAIFMPMVAQEGVWLPEYKADVRIRLNGVVAPDLASIVDNLFNLEAPMDEDQRLAHIERIIREYAVPLLNQAATISGMRDLDKTGKFRAAMITLHARGVMGQHTDAR